MNVIFYLRVAAILLFGIVPALFLSFLAGMGLLIGISLLLSDPLTGLGMVVVGFLGLAGTLSICDSLNGVSDNWRRLGLVAGIIAASVFLFAQLYIANMSSRIEPSYWVLSPIIVAVLLLLESVVVQIAERRKAD